MRKIYLLIICCVAILFGITIQSSVAEESEYIIVVSKGIENTVQNLQNRISNMIGEDVSCKKIDHRSPEAKMLIERQGIKFVPYVIFGEDFQKYDKFLDMIKKGAVIRKNNEFVIPNKMLRSLGIMFLERSIEAHKLDVFIMSQCPIGKSALKKLYDYSFANPGKFNIKVHYISDFNEFGVNSIRGPEEIREDIRQLLIQKYYPDKFWQYYGLYLQGKVCESIYKEIGIDSKIVDSHKKDGVELLKNDFELCSELNIGYSMNSSPTFLWENQILLSTLGQVYEIVIPEDIYSAADIEKNDGILPIILFYGPKCPYCRSLLEKQVPQLEKEFGKKISFKHYNIQIPQYAEKKKEMEEKYGVKNADRIPEVFVEGQALVGINDIRRKLRSSIKKNIGIKKKSNKEIEIGASIQAEPYSKKIVKRFKSFTFLAIIIAGLLDGINPCAFSTIVFFMSFLVFAKFSFRRMVVTGIFFILAVFLTYLGLGFGVFVGLEKVRIFVKFSEYFDISIGMITILLGIISLYDYFMYKKKGTSEAVILKLPSAIKNTVQSSIGSLRDKGKIGVIKLLIIAFGLGVLVSLLESMCTGQVYVPTLSFMIKMNIMWAKAFLYLLLYNLMFILPLFAVFLLTLVGFNSQWWAKIVRLNLARVKLVTAMFFLLMGIILIILR